MIREVDALNGMGALNTKEAVSMGVMKIRLNKVDKANWTEMKFLQEQCNCGGKRNTKGSEK